MKTKFEAKGILLRHFDNMGVNATEPFKPFVTDSKESVLDHITTMMVGNIIGCGFIITEQSKIENEDEMYIDKTSKFECFGSVTELECEKLKELCADI